MPTMSTQGIMGLAVFASFETFPAASPIVSKAFMMASWWSSLLLNSSHVRPALNFRARRAAINISRRYAWSRHIEGDQRTQDMLAADIVLAALDSPPLDKVHF